MKALVVVKPNVLKIMDFPLPEPGDYDVVCKNLYGSICTGTDLKILEGSFPFPVHYPLILGHETVGAVIKIGKKVRSFKEGDLIIGVRAVCPLPSIALYWGGFSEYGIAKDHESMKNDGIRRAQWLPYQAQLLIPHEIDPAIAPLFVTWRETSSYLLKMGFSKGARLLIIGSGGIGLSFAALAKNLKAETIVMIGNKKRSDSAFSSGVTEFFNYKAENSLTPPTRDRHFDFIIDTVGKANSLNHYLPHLKNNGKVGIFGIDEYHKIGIQPFRSPGNFTFYQGGYNEAETHQMIITMVLNGLLNPCLWYDRDQCFTLYTIENAFQKLKERKLVKALVSLSYMV